MRRRALVAAGAVLALAGLLAAVHVRFTMRERRIPRSVLAWAVAAHRARLSHEPAPPPPHSEVLSWTPPAPVAATLLRRGKPAFRVSSKGTLLAALRASAARLARAADGSDGTIRIDVPTARSDFFGVEWIDAFSIAPLADGIGGVGRGHVEYLAPYDLLAIGAYEKHWLQPDYGVGQTRTIEKARASLRSKVGSGDGWFRVRVASAVEGAPAKLASRPDARLTRENLENAARRGAVYLAGQIKSDGRYRYSYDPLRDRDAENDYNVPRHCGTTYFLAQAAGRLRDRDLALAAEPPLEYLRRRLVKRDERTGTLVAGIGNRVDTGSAALAVVALTEYRRVTGETRYDRTIRGLADFLLEMQRADGDFTHRYDLASGRRDPARLLYFTGEAALALLGAHAALGEPTFLEGAERALDYLVDENWRFFGSEYLPGEEHWTCIAANEAYPRIKKRRYLEFCRHWAALRRDVQLGPNRLGGGGGYGLAPMVVPSTTPTGSTTEASISTALLARKWHAPDREVEAQTKRAAKFLLQRQLTGEILHLFPDPEEARGGFPSSGADLDVRIDFVQHSGSALLRLVDLL